MVTLTFNISFFYYMGNNSSLYEAQSNYNDLNRKTEEKFNIAVNINPQFTIM